MQSTWQQGDTRCKPFPPWLWVARTDSWKDMIWSRNILYMYATIGNFKASLLIAEPLTGDPSDFCWVDGRRAFLWSPWLSVQGGEVIWKPIPAGSKNERTFDLEHVVKPWLHTNTARRSSSEGSFQSTTPVSERRVGTGPAFLVGTLILYSAALVRAHTYTLTRFVHKEQMHTTSESAAAPRFDKWAHKQKSSGAAKLIKVDLFHSVMAADVTFSAPVLPKFDRCANQQPQATLGPFFSWFSDPQ